MCLGIPGELVSIYGEDFERMGLVKFGTVEREISLSFVPEARMGDYVIVHVGYAISLLNRDAADQTLQLLDELEHFSLMQEKTDEVSQ